MGSNPNQIPIYPIAGCVDLQADPATVYEQAAGRHRVYDDYQHKQSFVNGIIQALLGIVCIISGSASVLFGVDGEIFSLNGVGIWTGVVFSLTGVFGSAAANKRNKCWIITFLTFCSLSIFCGLTTFSVTLFTEIRVYQRSSVTTEAELIEIGMQVILITASVIETCIAIWGAVICIRVIECNVSICKSSVDAISLVPGYQHVGSASLPDLTTDLYFNSEVRPTDYGLIGDIFADIQTSDQSFIQTSQGSQSTPDNTPPPSYTEHQTRALFIVSKERDLIDISNDTPCTSDSVV